MTDGRLKQFAMNNGYKLNAPIFPKGTSTTRIEGSTLIVTSTLTGTEEQLAAVSKVQCPTWSLSDSNNKIWHLAKK